MNQPDHYGVLGVPRDADFDQIRLAYRRKRREHHPDVGGSAEMFAQVQSAYDTLSDYQARLDYDRTLGAGASATAGAAAPAPPPVAWGTSETITPPGVKLHNPAPQPATTPSPPSPHASPGTSSQAASVALDTHNPPPPTKVPSTAKIAYGDDARSAPVLVPFITRGVLGLVPLAATWWAFDLVRHNETAVRGWMSIALLYALVATMHVALSTKPSITTRVIGLFTAVITIVPVAMASEGPIYENQGAAVSLLASFAGIWGCAEFWGSAGRLVSTRHRIRYGVEVWDGLLAAERNNAGARRFWVSKVYLTPAGQRGAVLWDARTGELERYLNYPRHMGPKRWIVVQGHNILGVADDHARRSWLHVYEGQPAPKIR